MKKSKNQKKTTQLLILLTLILLFLAFIFLAIVIFKKKAIQELDENAQICISMAKYAEPEQRYLFVQQCQRYLGNSCTKDRECGPFPCISQKCSIKPCDNDADCASNFCGKHSDSIKNFCITISEKP